MNHIFSEGDIVYLKKDMIDKYIDKYAFDSEQDLLNQLPHDTYRNGYNRSR